MKLFVITTKSESGDDYIYTIKHPKEPTEKELKAFLIEHSNDTEEGEDECTLFESIIEVHEVVEADALTIPKLSKKELDKWTEL
jgi:hypothetical protein